MRLYLCHYGLKELEPQLPARMRAVLAGYNIELYIPSRGKRFLKRDEKALLASDAMVLISFGPGGTRENDLVVLEARTFGEAHPDRSFFWGGVADPRPGQGHLAAAANVCFSMLALSRELKKQKDMLKLAIEHRTCIKEV